MKTRVTPCSASVAQTSWTSSARWSLHNYLALARCCLLVGGGVGGVLVKVWGVGGGFCWYQVLRKLTNQERTVSGIGSHRGQDFQSSRKKCHLRQKDSHVTRLKSECFFAHPRVQFVWTADQPRMPARCFQGQCWRILEELAYLVVGSCCPEGRVNDVKGPIRK